MHNQRETATDAARAEGRSEAEIMRPADWGPVIERIGTHPDLRLFRSHTVSQWYVYSDAPEGKRDSIPATPATVDGLMLQYCTAWLDEQGVEIRLSEMEFYFVMPGPGIQECEYYPTRIAATIAAVVAAEGGSK